MKRTLCMILTLLLILGCLTPVSALADQTGSKGGYVETEFKLPDGYSSPTTPTTTPDGHLALAARAADGGWALLTWLGGIAAEPTITGLDIGADTAISSIGISPEGELMCVFADAMLRMGGPSISTGGPEGEGPDGASLGEGPVMREGPVGGAVQGEGPVMRQGPDGEAVQGELADAPVMHSASSDPSGTSGGASGAPKMRIMSADDAKTSFAWFDAQGQRLSGGEIRGMMMATLALSGRRLAALQLSNGITIYDENGKQVSEIAKNDVFGMVAAPDGGLLLHQNGKLSVTDPDTGKELRSVAFEADYGTPLSVSPDGSVYAVSTKGIQRLAPDAQAFETVAEAAGYTIGDPSAYIGGACALSDGTLMVMIGGGSGIRVSGSAGRTSTTIGMGAGDDDAQLLAYVFNPDMDLSNRTGFSVTALYDSAKLRKAVSDFQRLHPELNVSLTAPIASGDYDTPTEDHIRTLNTDLLAGKGGDVLVLDGLPVDKYVEKGVLADLSSLANGLGVLPGIIAGSTEADGALYALPAQFSFDTIWGGKDAVAQLSDIESIANMALEGGQTPIYGRTPEDWLRLFYPASEASFRDANGNLRFDTPEFARFLDALWALYAAQAEEPDDEDADMLRRGGFSMKEAQAAINGSVALMPGKTASTMQSAIYFTATGKADSAAALVPGLDGPGTAYTPSLLMGINARSANKALAEEFVKLMFSDELQKMDEMEGLPTVASALDAMVDEAIELGKNTEMRMAVMMAGASEPLMLEQPDEAHWREIRALCDALNTAAPLDETLMGFIVEETASFFEGSVSADEAAAAVMQRAMAYLNE